MRVREVVRLDDFDLANAKQRLGSKTDVTPCLDVIAIEVPAVHLTLSNALKASSVLVDPMRCQGSEASRRI
jgi:hypothetical protein